MTPSLQKLTQQLPQAHGHSLSRSPAAHSGSPAAHSGSPSLLQSVSPPGPLEQPAKKRRTAGKAAREQYDVAELLHSLRASGAAPGALVREVQPGSRPGAVSAGSSPSHVWRAGNVVPTMTRRHVAASEPNSGSKRLPFLEDLNDTPSLPDPEYAENDKPGSHESVQGYSSRSQTLSLESWPESEEDRSPAPAPEVADLKLPASTTPALPAGATSHFSPREWASVRAMIVKQQTIFTAQVSELHTLVQCQRDMWQQAEGRSTRLAAAAAASAEWYTKKVNDGKVTDTPMTNVRTSQEISQKPKAAQDCALPNKVRQGSTKGAPQAAPKEAPKGPGKPLGRSDNKAMGCSASKALGCSASSSTSSSACSTSCASDPLGPKPGAKQEEASRRAVQAKASPHSPHSIVEDLECDETLGPKRKRVPEKEKDARKPSSKASGKPAAKAAMGPPAVKLPRNASNSKAAHWARGCKILPGNRFTASASMSHPSMSQASFHHAPPPTPPPTAASGIGMLEQSNCGPAPLPPPSPLPVHHHHQHPQHPSFGAVPATANDHSGLPSGLPLSPFWQHYAAFTAAFSAASQWGQQGEKGGFPAPGGWPFGEGGGFPGSSNPTVGANNRHLPYPWNGFSGGMPSSPRSDSGAYRANAAPQGAPPSSPFNHASQFAMGAAAAEAAGPFWGAWPAGSSNPAANGTWPTLSSNLTAGGAGAPKINEGGIARLRAGGGAVPDSVLASFKTPPPLRLIRDGDSRQHLVAADGPGAAAP